MRPARVLARSGRQGEMPSARFACCPKACRPCLRAPPLSRIHGTTDSRGGLPSFRPVFLEAGRARHQQGLAKGGGGRGGATLGQLGAFSLKFHIVLNGAHIDYTKFGHALSLDWTSRTASATRTWEDGGVAVRSVQVGAFVRLYTPLCLTRAQFPWTPPFLCRHSLRRSSHRPRCAPSPPPPPAGLAAARRPGRRRPLLVPSLFRWRATRCPHEAPHAQHADVYHQGGDGRLPP